MLRKLSSPATFDFNRAGGAIILGRLDVWKATTNGWQLVHSAEFKDATLPVESVSVSLPKGNYTAIFQCFVQESLNGRYRFQLAAGGTPVFASDGDVNTTPAANDTKVFKDQFILEVK